MDAGRIVEFRNSVAGREDPDLADRLVREALPSILAWALVGATRLAKSAVDSVRRRRTTA